MRMIQVDVTVNYDGLLYHTNVITQQDTEEEIIFQLAFDQVKKQLVEKKD